MILKNTITLFTTLKSINHLKDSGLGFEYRFARIGDGIEVRILNIIGKEVSRLNLTNQEFTTEDLLEWITKHEKPEKVLVD